MKPVASTTIAAFGTAAIGVAAVVGASVAVCLGHIDSATFIAIVGPLAGVGVGAGIHTAGVTSGVVASNGHTPPASAPQPEPAQAQ